MRDLTWLDSRVPLPGLRLPVRTPIVHLANGDVMISPGSRLTPEQCAGAGRVTDLVGPSLLHLAGMGKAAACFPGARVWGCEGAAAARPEVAWTGLLSPATWPYREELPALELDGMRKVRELVFLHRASRTLIATDLCFNLVESKGLAARIVLGLFGTFGRFAVSRLYLSYLTDRARFEASLRTLLEWEFDNIVMGHGSAIEGRGKDLLVAALRERGFCRGPC